MHFRCIKLHFFTDFVIRRRVQGKKRRERERERENRLTRGVYFLQKNKRVTHFGVGNTSNVLFSRSTGLIAPVVCKAGKRLLFSLLILMFARGTPRYDDSLISCEKFPSWFHTSRSTRINVNSPVSMKTNTRGETFGNVPAKLTWLKSTRLCPPSCCLASLPLTFLFLHKPRFYSLSRVCVL